MVGEGREIEKNTLCSYTRWILLGQEGIGMNTLKLTLSS